MDNWIEYIILFAAGTIISLLYHGGLWWTVRSLPRSRRPVLLSIGSFYLRMALALAAFFIIMQDDWRRLTVCLIGFILVKFIMTQMIGPYKKASL